MSGPAAKRLRGWEGVGVKKEWIDKISEGDSEMKRELESNLEIGSAFAFHTLADFIAKISKEELRENVAAYVEQKRALEAAQEGEDEQRERPSWQRLYAVRRRAQQQLREQGADKKVEAPYVAPAGLDDSFEEVLTEDRPSSIDKVEVPSVQGLPGIGKTSSLQRFLSHPGPEKITRLSVSFNGSTLFDADERDVHKLNSLQGLAWRVHLALGGEDVPPSLDFESLIDSLFTEGAEEVRLTIDEFQKIQYEPEKPLQRIVLALRALMHRYSKPGQRFNCLLSVLTDGPLQSAQDSSGVPIRRLVIGLLSDEEKSKLFLRPDGKSFDLARLNAIGFERKGEATEQPNSDWRLLLAGCGGHPRCLVHWAEEYKSGAAIDTPIGFSKAEERIYARAKMSTTALTDEAVVAVLRRTLVNPAMLLGGTKVSAYVESGCLALSGTGSGHLHFTHIAIVAVWAGAMDTPLKVAFARLLDMDHSTGIAGIQKNFEAVFARWYAVQCCFLQEATLRSVFPAKRFRLKLKVHCQQLTYPKLPIVAKENIEKDDSAKLGGVYSTSDSQFGVEGVLFARSQEGGKVNIWIQNKMTDDIAVADWPEVLNKMVKAAQKFNLGGTDVFLLVTTKNTAFDSVAFRDDVDYIACTESEVAGWMGPCGLAILLRWASRYARAPQKGRMSAASGPTAFAGWIPIN